jgi:quercetin dioxygenase-like cupin family protein
MVRAWVLEPLLSSVVPRASAGASRSATARTDGTSSSRAASTATRTASGTTTSCALVDKRLDAQLHTMFMVAYEPGGIAHPHDHPFEESYSMLGGEIDVVADGDRHTLLPGDAFWTSVGCIHAFYETKGGTALWLETSAPGPPDRHAYGFDRDWDYLAERLG